MTWSKLLSLCPEVQTHTGSTAKASQGKDFPPAPKEGGSSTLPAPPLSSASGDTGDTPVVTPLETPRNLSGGWVQPQLLALLPAITSCIPGAAPASARGLQQGKAALDPSGFTARDLITEGLQPQHLGAAQPRSSCFPLVFWFAF